MKQQVKVFRKATSDEQAIDIAHRIKVIDYELMRIVTGSNTGPNPLTGRLAGQLARMQRDLRALRIQMEVERRFDTAPMTV